MRWVGCDDGRDAPAEHRRDTTGRDLHAVSGVS
jgi:hypothetical protein